MNVSSTPRQINWVPGSIWQWLLAGLAALSLLAGLIVGGYVVQPEILGAPPSRVHDAMIFPQNFLNWILSAVVLAIIARWCGARLAATGFALSVILGLLIVLWQTLSIWSMAKRENIAVSLASHFAFERHMTDLPSRVSRDVIYGRAADGTVLGLDIWPAMGAARDALRPAIVKVHGGAWIFGAKSGLPNWDAWLNELGYVVFDVDYRVPPPDRWKDEVGDVKCALGWVFNNAGKYGIDPLRISIIGHSAGGNLAMLAAYSTGSPDLPPSCPAPTVPIKSIVNIYGPSDLAALFATTRSPAVIRDALKKYVGGSITQFPDRYKALSPLSHIDAKSPPTITILGLSDSVVPREQADKLDRALAAADVAHETYLLPGTDHDFDFNWGAISTQFARSKIKAFLEKHG
jgi:acetyl esterase/lipase